MNNSTLLEAAIILWKHRNDPPWNEPLHTYWLAERLLTDRLDQLYRIAAQYWIEGRLVSPTLLNALIHIEEGLLTGEDDHMTDADVHQRVCHNLMKLTA